MELELVKWGLYALLGLGGWLMKRTVDRIEHQVDELSKETQRIREDYLHKSDFKEFKIELRSMFEEIKQNIRSIKP